MASQMSLVRVTQDNDAPDETNVMTYYLNPDAAIAELDTSDPLGMYQISTGANRYQVSGVVVRLISHLRSPLNADALYAAFCLEQPTLTRDVFDVVLERLVAKDGLIVTSNDNISTSATQSRNPNALADWLGKGGKHGFALRLRLCTPQMLRPLTTMLSGLFSKSIVWPLTFLLFLCHAVFCYAYLTPVHSRSVTLAPGDWAPLVLLVYLGVFFHELGHAAACTRFGIQHGDIGLGVYVVYPVFYSDVSESWLLKRHERMVVDIGGLYFQFIYSAIAAMAWIATGRGLYFLITTSLLAGTLINLNPFLRFDGYWLLSDYLGHPRLHKASRDFWSYVVERLFRHHKATAAKPDFLTYSARLRTALIAYSCLSLLFITVFGYRVIRVTVPSLLRTYFLDIQKLCKAITGHGMTGLGFSFLFHFSLLSVTLVGMCRLLGSLAARRRWRRDKDQRI